MAIREAFCQRKQEPVSECAGNSRLAGRSCGDRLLAARPHDDEAFGRMGYASRCVGLTALSLFRQRNPGLRPGLLCGRAFGPWVIGRPFGPWVIGRPFGSWVIGRAFRPLGDRAGCAERWFRLDRTEIQGSFTSFRMTKLCGGLPPLARLGLAPLHFVQDDEVL